MAAGKTSLPPQFQQLAGVANRLLAQSGPARKLLLGQLTEALRTGGVKARIPIIQQAVSASNQATAQATRQTAEELAARNISGPFAARALASTRMAGAEQSAQIPTQMAQGIISQTTPFVAATQSLGAGSLGQVGQASFASDAFNAQQFKALMEDIKDSMMGGASMAACLHPDAPIETPSGVRAVDTLSPGDVVWSTNRQGERVPARVIRTQSLYVGWSHKMLKLHGPGGYVFHVSPNHPDEHGQPIGDYIANPRVDHVTDVTCDIAVDGDTGVYFVAGVALGSTIDPRFLPMVNGWSTTTRAA